MFEDIAENIMVLGPVFVVMWALTISLSFLRPQRYFNSFLLMASLFVTLIFISGMFGDYAGVFLMASFIIIFLILLMVPVLLIINGIQMIRRESLCLAHVLSLALGIFIGVGEIAAFWYLLDAPGAGYGYKAGELILLTVFTVFYFSCLVLSFVVYSVFIQKMPHVMNFNYVIIHGCGLADGERLTKLLSNRVDKAIEIYSRCKNKPVIIPSGGKGSDEKLSEAQAMKNYLLEKGIPEENILMEDTSATTYENLINSKKIIDSRDGKKKTALVSSNYHIYRCLRYAREIGLKCTGIGADVALYYWPSALIREFIAVFTEKRFLIMAMIGYLLFIGPLLLTFLRG